MRPYVFEYGGAVFEIRFMRGLDCLSACIVRDGVSTGRWLHILDRRDRPEAAIRRTLIAECIADVTDGGHGGARN